MQMTEEELDQKARDKAFVTMRDELDSSGVTSKHLIEKLKEELIATETKTFQHQGLIIESGEKIAWDVRQRARQDAHKLRGDYPAEKHQLEGTLTDPRSKEEREAILAIAREVVERLRKDGTNSPKVAEVEGIDNMSSKKDE